MSFQSVSQSVSRRDIIKGAVVSAGSLVLATVFSKSTPAAAATLSSSISSNHGHRFTADLAQLLANGATDYSIRGKSFHDHTLTITDAILATLQQAKVVEIESSSDAFHSHIVRLEII